MNRRANGLQHNFNDILIEIGCNIYITGYLTRTLVNALSFLGPSFFLLLMCRLFDNNSNSNLFITCLVQISM